MILYAWKIIETNKGASSRNGSFSPLFVNFTFRYFLKDTSTYLQACDRVSIVFATKSIDTTG